MLALLALALLPMAPLHADELEKVDLKFGFIKLTDCAPLVIAREQGFFDDEGLNVTLEAQSNWKILLDRVISGELDGVHMLAGQPIAATIGFGTKAHIITAFSMDLNGNGITVSKSVWQKMLEIESFTEKPETAAAHGGGRCSSRLCSSMKAEGKPLRMGMVFPVSTHNYDLRYWLASGGISPGYYTANGHQRHQRRRRAPLRDAAAANAGNAGPGHDPRLLRGRALEPTSRLQRHWRFASITDYEVWKNNPEKVFGITAELAEKISQHDHRFDQGAHPRGQMARRQPREPREGLRNSGEARIRRRRQANHRQLHDRHVGILSKATSARWRTSTSFSATTRPIPTTATPCGILTQMRRWGQIHRGEVG